jgi:hypothetical protein
MSRRKRNSYQQALKIAVGKTYAISELSYSSGKIFSFANFLMPINARNNFEPVQ